MKPFTRNASVLWGSSRATRKDSDAMRRAEASKMSHAFGARRAASTGRDPPELIAEAHAGSFSVILIAILKAVGCKPRRIKTTATVTMEHLESRWTLTQVHLDILAAVPGMAQCDFIDAALRAKSDCPISRLLNANISLHAHLDT